MQMLVPLLQLLGRPPAPCFPPFHLAHPSPTYLQVKETEA